MNNIYIDKFGTKIYKNTNGQYHRLDGPAIEYTDGYKEWWVNNKLHRLDGPAVKKHNGTKIWYLNDKRHRLDGPAVEYAIGDKYWYFNFNDISSVEDFLIFAGSEA